MAYEMMVGLNVKDNDVYTEYRAAMKPLLVQAEGGFRYDFMVSETLKAESGDDINRVFAIYFGDKLKMESFFSNPDYLKVKEEFFERSVVSTTIISQYER